MTTTPPPPPPTSLGFSPAIVPPAIVENARFFVTQGDGIIIRPEGTSARLPSADELLSVGITAANSEYLGRLNGSDLFAAQLAVDVALPAPFVVRKLRTLFTWLDEATFSVAGRAVQISAWLDTHRFCGRCASATVRVPSERATRCEACDLSFYPRISPAIIVLVRRGDEALLARGTRFPIPMYSTLAGFSEAGESLEETLAREVFEEVGIRIKHPRYFGSQSWPFPNSLMIGYFAEYDGGEITVEKTEIVDAKWFSAAEVAELMIPPKGLSISRRLIDAWLDEIARR